MQLIIKNQTANPLSYVQGSIIVAANGSAVVPRQYNTLLAGDAGFLSDSANGNIVVNNGYVDLAQSSIIFLAQTLSAFATTPIATIPLYYSLPVNLRQSAATTAGTVVWAMRNNSASPKIVMVEEISMIMSFDAGTPITRQSLRYEFVRFNSATPTGGNQITPTMMDSSAPSTMITDARYLDTGLTVSGVVFENAFASVGCPASDGASVTYQRHKPIKLAAGEGLAIRLTNNAATGQGLFGEIIWSER
jgi:hypothetical protein